MDEVVNMTEVEIQDEPAGVVVYGQFSDRVEPYVHDGKVVNYDDPIDWRTFIADTVTAVVGAS